MRRPKKLGDLTALELTGDSDALTYGGGVVFRRDGETWWQFWDAPSTKNYEVWTAKVPVNVLRAYKTIPRDDFVMQLGLDESDIRSMSTSSRYQDRLRLLEAVIEMEGRSRVCPLGPDTLTRHEMMQRWGPLYGVDPDTFPRYDAEDYMIAEFEEGFGCGQVEGRFLGLYESFECCAAAIAEDMEANILSAHVYVLGDDDELEKLEWSRSRWLNQPQHRVRVGFAKATWRFRMRAFVKETRKKGRKLTKAEKAVNRLVRGTIRKSRT